MDEHRRESAEPAGVRQLLDHDHRRGRPDPQGPAGRAVDHRHRRLPDQSQPERSRPDRQRHGQPRPARQPAPTGRHLHYDDATGTPEIYGGFALQTGQLAQLQQLGINVAGTAVLLFNSTSNTIPNQTIAFPDKTTKTYSLPADSVSLQIIGSADFQHGGQDWFSLNGQLDAFFTFSKDASGTVHPELQVDFFGTMLVGPSTSPYLSFMGSGYLQLSDAGIAAEMNVSLLPNQTLASAGILLKNDTFTLLLNTTGQEITYTIPAVTDPSQGVVSGAGTAVDIPAAPTGTTTPSPYLQINGQGELDIESSFDLTGSFSMLAAPGVLTFGLNMNFGLVVQGTTLESFHVQGGLTFNSQGVVAAHHGPAEFAVPLGLWVHASTRRSCSK